ncbi:MAG TPA: SDR family NAD(P)-dependent oxidoreductase [Bacteriovoracaceae bacterium]|nr:SDR family NAD(P)-dependent oxidoreductase [Bacteriovoracaceae bacterium]
MNLSNNTVLITGGTSGIGLEFASQLLELGNTIIVTGRDQTKLDEAKKRLPKIHILQSDVSDPKAIGLLYAETIKKFPDLNIVINNAGIMRKINLNDPVSDLENLTREIETNLLGTIWMSQQYLPHLKTKKTAAIVNVSSGLAFVPFPISPVYSATKSAVHAFTQCLRLQLKNTTVKVFELAPPGTETALFRGDFTAEDLGGVKSMDVKVMVKRAIAGLKKDQLEIRPGLSNVLKTMGRIAPEFMLGQLSRPLDSMLSRNKN